MKKLIMIFFFAMNGFCALAQNMTFTHAYTNESKYWFYRNRLINEFMVLGGDEFVPFNANGTCNIASFVWKGNSYLSFGDGTIRIGQYLAVLATEYKLLSKHPLINKEALLETKKEIAYILMTLDRLDLMGEARGGTPTSNGYLARSDVYSNDFNNNKFPVHERFNAFYKKSNAFLDSKTNLPVDIQIGDAFNFPVSLHQMTQDQVNHLLIGFRFIDKYIPSGTSYSDAHLNMPDIKNYSKGIVTRIMDYVCDGGDWIIKDPLTGKKITEQGGDVSMLSFGFATAAAIPTKKFYPASAENSLGFKTAGRVVSISNNNNFKFQSLAALGNGWDDICVQAPCFDFDCIVKIAGHCIAKIPIPKPISSCPCTINLMTSNTLDKYSKEAHYEFLPLMNKLLYDRTGFEHNTDYYQNFYASKIEDAPCRGPWSYSQFTCAPRSTVTDLNYWEYVDTESHGKHGWSSYNLFFAATRGENWYWYAGDAEVCSKSRKNDFTRNFLNWPASDYCGIDYMLLYNLYQLYAMNEWQNNVYDYYMPNYGNNLYLHDYTPTHSVENFTARSFDQNNKTMNGDIYLSNGFTCAANKTVNFIAGNSIVFEPGYTTETGAIVTMNIYHPLVAGTDSTDNLAWEMDCIDINTGQRVAANGDNNGYNTPLQPSTISEGSSLGQNFPNPFSELSKFSYKLTTAGPVKITVNDILNKTISELVNEKYQEAGMYEVDFDGSKLKSGIYYYTLETGKYLETKKMVIIK